MLIIAVVFAIATPRFSQANARQQQAMAAERLKSDLELARARARASSQNVTVMFNRSGASYGLSGAGEAFAVELDEAPYRAQIGHVAFGDAGDEFVTFNAFGIAHAEGRIEINRGHLRQITVRVKASGEVE